MQRLTIKAATQESTRALYDALHEFHPELDQDEHGSYHVSAGLGSDRRALEILDAIQAFLADRAVGTVDSMTVSLDGRNYTLHSEAGRESPA